MASFEGRVIGAYPGRGCEYVKLIVLRGGSQNYISSGLILLLYKHYKTRMDSMNSLRSEAYSTPTRAAKCQHPDHSSLQSTAPNSTQTRSPHHHQTAPLPPINLLPAFQASSATSSLGFAALETESAVTDRYIPSRKLLKLQSMGREEESEMEEEDENVAGEQSGRKVIDLYRRYVMEQSPARKEQAVIQSFENSNILRFSSRHNHSQLQPLQKSSSFEFAEHTENGCKKRRVNKVPIKVLDAPALQDDYYLNLIDWSSQNFLAVGLSSSVYLWNAANSKVNKLCDLGAADSTTAVGWSLKGPHFSLGTNNGDVQIWDIAKMKKVRTLGGHSNRVGAIAWSSALLSTGSRDKTILQRDLRESAPFVNRLLGHRQEVCGLKWSPDEQQLCSGGNDNKLLVWNNHSAEPILKYCDHLAAVKAVAWSPHQHGLLVSGGGTADRTIRFRNTLSGSTVKTVDVGSQVCNLMFSKSLNQLVSTHGYSHNEINIWKYPRMEKIATLTGHTYRVLYLAMSPDGSTIVTGAGDETLRFWNVFPNRNEPSGKKTASYLNTDSIMLR